MVTDTGLPWRIPMPTGKRLSGKEAGLGAARLRRGARGPCSRSPRLEALASGVRSAPQR